MARKQAKADERVLESWNRIQPTVRSGKERDLTLALIDAAILGKDREISEMAMDFNPEWVMDPMLRDICSGLLKLCREGKPITDTQLIQILRKGCREYKQGPEYVADLITSRYGWSHLKYFAKEVYDEYRRYGLAEEADQIISELVNGSDLDPALDAMVNLPDKYQGLDFSNTDRAKEAIMELLAEEEAAERQEYVPKFLTGIEKLDFLLGGIEDGSLLTVAAETGYGKSLFMGQLALRCATMYEKHVLYFSAEMTIKQMQKRWLPQVLRIENPSRRAKIEGYNKVLKLTEQGGPLQLYEGVCHVDRIVARTRAYEYANLLGLVVVDYIQLYQGGNRTDTRERQIADISQKLKGLALEMKIPVMTASQFNRAHDGTPGINNLRESGAIAQDSDIVMLIDVGKDHTQRKWKADIRVSKNRSGRTGRADVVLDSWFLEFQDAPVVLK